MAMRRVRTGEGCAWGALMGAIALVTGAVEAAASQPLLVAVQQQQAVTLSWFFPAASTCEASGGWSGARPPSGTETITNVTAPTVFRLACTGVSEIALTVTPAPEIPPPVPAGFVAGINGQLYAGKLDAAGREFVLELGARSIRIGSNPGEDYDGAINWATTKGIGVVLILGFGSNVETEVGRQRYADRAAGLAQKYGDKVQYYEMWNEFNGGMGLGGWPGCKPTCQNYALYTDLLCRTYRAIKAVRPSEKVVGGDTAGVDLGFIGGILDAGAGKCMDALSLHTYTYAQFPGAKFNVPLNASVSVAADRWVEGMNAANNLIRQKLGMSMPILVTETGRNDAGSAGSEQGVAEFLTEVFKRARTLPFLEGVWWFALEDVAAARWGVVRADNSKKPAFGAYQSAVK